MKIKKAERSKIKVPIMLMGASGAGKTLSALLIAKGIVESMFPDMVEAQQWEKVGMIETEHNRSSLYVNTEHDGATIGQFLQIELEPPFTADRYEEAFKLFKDNHVEVIIVDSLSSVWSGEGGILDKVNQFGGSIGDWKKVSPDQKKVLHMLTDSDVHVIATVRSKQGVEVTRSDTGKVQVEKVGLKPDQKDGLEYEFAITFQIYQNHIAQAMKDNSSIFDTAIQLDRNVGHKIYAWAEQGVDINVQRKVKAQAAFLKLVSDRPDLAEAAEELKNQIGKKDLSEWTFDELKNGYKHLMAWPKKEKQEA
ncbi:AAA family ATPase [Lacticaseibacillus paracasei]|uniref:AAA family ATPase n=1 Tax=Lacticaseibacillus paracasei TaxID=1597 RepID=UPI003F614CA3